MPSQEGNDGRGMIRGLPIRDARKTRRDCRAVPPVNHPRYHALKPMGMVGQHFQRYWHEPGIIATMPQVEDALAVCGSQDASGQTMNMFIKEAIGMGCPRSSAFIPENR